MEVYAYPAGIYQANCYIVNAGLGEGFVVDPGGDCDGILKIIKDKKISVKFIILTHGHFDHIGAVKCLKERLHIPVYMNKKDAYMVNSKNSGVPFFKEGIEQFEIDGFLSDNDKLKVGEKEITIYETPGHTPGGISIFVGNAVFTGDTLFCGSVGRSDFAGGSYEAIMRSIKEKIMILPDYTIVYPGHGPSTTIGEQKESNPFLQFE